MLRPTSRRHDGPSWLECCESELARIDAGRGSVADFFTTTGEKSDGYLVHRFAVEIAQRAQLFRVLRRLPPRLAGGHARPTSGRKGPPSRPEEIFRELIVRESRTWRAPCTEA